MARLSDLKRQSPASQEQPDLAEQHAAMAAAARRRPEPTTMDALREVIASQSRPGRIPAGKSMTPRTDMEARYGADMVMAVAAMAAQIHGFPDDVVVSAPDDRNPSKDWVALQRQQDGVWRIVSERAGDPDGARTFSGWGRDSLVFMVARAMGFSELPEGAYRTLQAFGPLPKRPDDVEPFISEIEAAVPPYVLRAPLVHGFGSDFRESISGPLSVADAWVRSLASRGLDVNRPSSGQSAQAPLLSLVGQGHAQPSLVAALVDAGADIEALDGDGRTALLLSLGKGDFQAAKVLMDKGADASAMDDDGHSAMDYLVQGLRLGYAYPPADPAGLARRIVGAGCVEGTRSWSDTLDDMISEHVRTYGQPAGIDDSGFAVVDSLTDLEGRAVIQMREVLAVHDETLAPRLG